MNVTEHAEQSTAPVGEQLYDIPTARRRLGGISRGSIYKLFANGELAWVRVGGRRMVAGSDLEAFIAANREAAA
jgi:excisionase family DNA binding protein